MKQLLDVGKKSHDLTLDDTIAELDLTMFTDLKNKLALPKEEHVYILYWWLQYTIDYTLFRTQDKGTVESGVSSQLGAQAVMVTMAQMEMEFPTIIYGLQMQASLGTTQNSCLDIYQKTFGFPEA